MIFAYFIGSETNMVALRCQLQFYATLNFMPGFIVFRRSNNTTLGMTPTRLGSRDMGDGNCYMDLFLLVVMTPSC